MDIKKLALVLKSGGISVFEYFPERDTVVLYDERLQPEREIADYLSLVEQMKDIHPEDLWKVIEFYQGRYESSVKFRYIEKDGSLSKKCMSGTAFCEADGKVVSIVGSVRDVTKDTVKEKNLESQARRDALTGLYNYFYGKKLISEYLEHKNPYDSCGLMVIDVDYFKDVNDTYGHLFGDEVLEALARLFTEVFDPKDIIMRSGGDEFVVLLKNIDDKSLLRKSMQLVKAVRRKQFSESEFSLTCSAGVCFLPENVSGYTYDQLFKNADWALYKAKEKGKNRYAFCDNLKRFELMDRMEEVEIGDIDARYMRNDLVSTAFEVFEKFNSFNAAMELLLKVIGVRLHLDRITVIRTNLKEKWAGRQYQWLSDKAPVVLDVPGGFTKEDFLTLFQSYDEYGTTVLQYDNMSMYSKDAENLLMQGGAKTVVYAAMYCEGQYTGAISYVTCQEKRYWSKQGRRQLGEVTKIISAHLAKNQVMNSVHQSGVAAVELDSLTGLISFSRFREEAERIIVGGYGNTYVMIYLDFVDFKKVNRTYGYSAGDRLLKEFSNYVVENLKTAAEVYFTRVVADQFILFMPCGVSENISEGVASLIKKFTELYEVRFPDIKLEIRSGIYRIESSCTSASEAIDAANEARRKSSLT